MLKVLAHHDTFKHHKHTWFPHSGGKDSCYSSMLCCHHGHEIIALGNLFPALDGTDELNSYMYQTVGHQVVAAYAACANLPLFRRRLIGSTKQQVSCKRVLASSPDWCQLSGLTVSGLGADLQHDRR